MGERLATHTPTPALSGGWDGVISQLNDCFKNHIFKTLGSFVAGLNRTFLWNVKTFFIVELGWHF